MPLFGQEHRRTTDRSIPSVAGSYQNLAGVSRDRETKYRQKRWSLRHTIYS